MSTSPEPPPTARLSVVDEVGQAVLLDLSAWFGAWSGPVPANVAYAQEALRAVEGGRSRLARYVEPELLRRWDAALEPFFAAGPPVVIRLGSMSFDPLAEDRGRIEFSDLTTPGSAPRWRLELRVDPVRRFVRNASLTRL